MQAEFQGIVYDGVLTCADDFCDLVRRSANGLQARGILENDAIAILMRNEPRMVASILAAQSIGCFPVLINWHGTRDEAAYVLSDCGAKALIAHADLVAGADDWLPRGCYSIVADVPAACLRTYRIDLS